MVIRRYDVTTRFRKALDTRPFVVVEQEKVHEDGSVEKRYVILTHDEIECLGHFAFQAKDKVR